jgi:hypothetical protein
LRFKVREEMIAFMLERYPEALPRVRTDLSDQRAGAAARTGKRPSNDPDLLPGGGRSGVAPGAVFD